MRLCNNLSTPCKNPDLLVRFQEYLDIGVAEVSLEPSALKDTGDLCRIALWSKRLLDQIVTRFENMDQIKLIFLQVIGQTCVFYTMMRADAVCVAVEFARLKIAIPAFPLIYKSMLKDSGAVFAGWTQDEMYGQFSLKPHPSVSQPTIHAHLTPHPSPFTIMGVRGLAKRIKETDGIQASSLQKKEVHVDFLAMFFGFVRDSCFRDLSNTIAKEYRSTNIVTTTTEDPTETPYTQPNTIAKENRSASIVTTTTEDPTEIPYTQHTAKGGKR
ncbi:hypothetical protein B0O80DRAFT_492822 [Mortierella sp. GBAus27b]|nr:hypothetical protein B0O80DRAFT_492822 [Mortierella sp. GBAus27b]